MLMLPKRKTTWLINDVYRSLCVVSCLLSYILCCVCLHFCSCCSMYFISFQVEKYYRWAMEIYENNYGVDDPNVAKTLSNLVCLSFIFIFLCLFLI